MTVSRLLLEKPAAASVPVSTPVAVYSATRKLALELSACGRRVRLREGWQLWAGS
jgi:hypothetical protein